MNQVTGGAIAILHILANILIVACLIAVAAKVVWNIGLPYAMLRERLRGVHRGWSLFPAIEVVPLLVAMGLAFVISSSGVLDHRTIASWGFAMVVGSYCHLAVASLCCGVFMWCRDRGK